MHSPICKVAVRTTHHVPNARLVARAPMRLKVKLGATACSTDVNVPQVLDKLSARNNLSEQETQQTLKALLTNYVPEQVAAFLVLLKAKGETSEEVAGLAKAMLEEGLPVKTNSTVVDIVGTGGDGIGSVNISTGACMVAAAAGAKIAKHGNRSVSSLCGSADVLEALGVVIDLGPESVAKCIDQAGIGFMFAPRYHPAMKAIQPVRRALKIRTAFNLLGPLLNPAHAGYGLVGVYSPEVSTLMAGALLRLGVRKALVVHSMGLDELTPMGPTDVVEVEAGKAAPRRYSVDPLELGIKRCSVEDLKGGDAALNASILRDVFGGARGAVADALNLNAGFALAASQVAASPAEGVAMAREVQQAGKAAEVLNRWVALSQQLAAEERSHAAAAKK